MAVIKVRVPGKINLTLEVLHRRADGYHEVATILQAIDLWDELALNEAPTVSLQCSLPELEGPDNLVERAARLLAASCGVTKGAAMHLQKGIPVAAGLGGGSADAAAALVGLDQMWGLGCSHERLHALAVELGSDVAFFLTGGTALATGRGERVAPLPAVTPAWLVLVSPPIALPRKTATLYAALAPEDFGDGGATERVKRQLAAGEPITSASLVNTFERVVYGVFPRLQHYARLFRDAGAERVHVAGSGPSLFFLVRSQQEGRALVERLHASGLAAWCVRTVASGVEFR